MTQEAPGINIHHMTKLVKGEIEGETAKAEVGIKVEMASVRGTMIAELFKHSPYKLDNNLWHFLLQFWQYIADNNSREPRLAIDVKIFLTLLDIVPGRGTSLEICYLIGMLNTSHKAMVEALVVVEIGVEVSSITRVAGGP